MYTHARVCVVRYLQQLQLELPFLKPLVLILKRCGGGVGVSGILNISKSVSHFRKLSPLTFATHVAPFSLTI